MVDYFSHIAGVLDEGSLASVQQLCDVRVTILDLWQEKGDKDSISLIH